jgi:hypothetical protein
MTLSPTYWVDSILLSRHSSPHSISQPVTPTCHLKTSKHNYSTMKFYLEIISRHHHHLNQETLLSTLKNQSQHTPTITRENLEGIRNFILSLIRGTQMVIFFPNNSSIVLQILFLTTGPHAKSVENLDTKHGIAFTE